MCTVGPRSRAIGSLGLHTATVEFLGCRRQVCTVADAGSVNSEQQLAVCTFLFQLMFTVVLISWIY
jgi:hypothetical protein